jgi:beta-lactamase regulating signal transducer with metallopeptidase domain
MSILLRLLESPVVQRLGWTLLHFVWQGALIGALAAVGLLLLRRSATSARHALLLAAFVMLALAPVATFTVVTPVPARTIAAEHPLPNAPVLNRPSVVRNGVAGSAFPPGAQDEPPAGLTQTPESASSNSSPSTPAEPVFARTIADRCRPALPWLVIAWVAGVILLTIRLVGAWWRLRRLLTRDVWPLVDRWATLTSHMCDAFDVHRKVQFLESRLADVPVVISWLRPVVLVPTSIMTNLTPAEVEALLAHELAHIRRRDDVVNLLQTVIETLLFYHPAVWWLSARLRQEREHCCDDLAAEMIGDRVIYSRALMAAAQLATSRPERLAVAANGGKLVVRIRRLLGRTAIGPVQPQSRWPVVAILLLMMLAAVGLVASRPSAQEPPPVLGAADRNRANSDAPAPGEPGRESTDAAQADLASSQIVTGIEEAMLRFASVDYSAEYGEQRDANAFRDGVDPLLLDGTGRYTFRTDGRRWFADEHGFTYSIGTTDVSPTRAVSGFDGNLHYVREGDVVTLAEDHLAVERCAPAHVFWEVGRNWSWLKAALNDASARIVDRPVIDGHHCIAVHSEWSPAWAGTIYVFDVVVSPEQSFLPLTCTITENGQAEDEWQISELGQTTEGTWYPRVIQTSHRRGLPVRSRQLAITSLALRSDFRDADFAYAVPSGVDVIDYPRGAVYFNDPWQPELGPWLRDRFDIPTLWIQPTDDIGSHCDGTIHGQPAPAIEAMEWVGGDPGPWNRPGRQYTILFFFGGRLISPTPQWIAGLKALQQKYAEAGVELIGVASSSSGEEVRQTVRELNIAFPVAIATPSDQAGSYGRTHDGFGLPSYTGVFVIDPQGTVHVVNNPRPAGDAQLALEPLIQKLLGLPPEEFARDEDGLSIEDWRATINEWRRLRAAAHGQARMVGSVMYNHPLTRLPDYSNITVTLTPLLRVVSGHTPHGHTVHSEDSQAVSTRCDRDGRFEFTDLRKGTYTLAATLANYEKHEQIIAVPADEAVSVDDVKVLLNRAGAR